MSRPKGTHSNAAERLVQAAGEGFRTGGFGGVGVDGLARQAGLTSGAFYAHFRSKADAFRLVVQAGLAALGEGIRAYRTAHGATWFPAFVDFYLGARREADLSHSCGFQSLSGDVMRADEATRQVYTAELRGLVTAMTQDAAGLDRPQALAGLALLLGGVTMARAVDDPALAGEIARAVRTAACSLPPMTVDQNASLATTESSSASV